MLAVAHFLHNTKTWDVLLRSVLLCIYSVVVCNFTVRCSSANGLSFGPLHYVTTIPHPDLTVESHFGSRIWVQHDTVLVGAPREHLGPLVLGKSVGAAYTFTSEGDFIARFDNPNPDAEDLFGSGGAILSNGNVIVGAFEDDTLGQEAGIAYLFSDDGDLIREVESPSLFPEASFFGRKIVEIQHEIYVAAHADASQDFARGAIHIYNLGGEFDRSIFPSEEIVGEGFGIRMTKMPTDELLIGVVADDGDGNNSGAAYIIDLEGNIKKRFSNPDPDAFDRFSVWGMESQPKEFVLLGIHGPDDFEATSEQAYVFDLNGEHLATLDDPNPNPGDGNWFGRHMESIQDEFFAVTSIFDDVLGDNRGAVHLYDTEGNLISTLHGPNGDQSHFFGGALVTHESKDLVYIGELLANVGGTNSVGAVHIYEIVFNPGDANWDGVVDLLDFNALKDAFGAGSHFREGDFDRDDDVDLDDFAILKESFGNRYNDDDESPVVPEPHGLWLALSGLALAGWMGRRRRCPGRLDSGQ